MPPSSRTRAVELVGAGLCGLGLGLVGTPTDLEGDKLLVVSRGHAVTTSDLLALVVFLLGLALLHRLLTRQHAARLVRDDPDAVSLLVLGLGTCLAAVDLGNAASWLCVVGGALFAAGLLRASADPQHAIPPPAAAPRAEGTDPAGAKL